MRLLLACWWALLVGPLLLGKVFLDTKAHGAELQPVRVLYCGNLADARTADFRDFLERHFAKVACASAAKFTPDQAQDCDVVILDWSDLYVDGGLDIARMRAERAPKLDADYARPTILIGHMGGHAARPLKIKIDWLCLCMEGPAHKPALEHTIFHSPLEVDAQLEDFPTPAGYENRTLDKTLGATMKVLRVQAKEYPQIDPGLVSELYGFNDSPDAEVFAQGISKQGPDTVSLGRHANFLLWGYSAAPSDMTPAGQRLLVNAICYIRRFDGQHPLVRTEAKSRLSALRGAMTPRVYAFEIARMRTPEFRDEFMKSIGNNKELIPKQFNGDVEAFLAHQTADLEKVGSGYLKKHEPEALYQQFGEDAEKYLAYYRENLEWLRSDEGESATFVVDEDAKALGVSNRSVELLDRCVTLLERNEDQERAKRLLLRYTGQVQLNTPAAWRAWLEANRERLFFSDRGGYRFFVAPASVKAPSGAK